MRAITKLKVRPSSWNEGLLELHSHSDTGTFTLLTLDDFFQTITLLLLCQLLALFH